LKKCEGDCDDHRQCAPGLLCWHRNFWDQNKPPGCIGSAHDHNADYCYDPRDRIQTVNKGGEASNLGVCEGDCDHDWDCNGIYNKCWQRGTASTIPPGCKGDIFGEKHDFCYDNRNDKKNALPPGECPYPGFYQQDGDVSGSGKVGGRGGGEAVESCDKCAELCMSFEDCSSYECSYTYLKCNLNVQADPSEGRHQDYIFCTKGNPVVTAQAALFGHDVFYPFGVEHDDNGNEYGNYVLVLPDYSLWVLAVVLCAVFSVLLAVMVRRGGEKKRYRIVAAVSDTDCA